jgi:hypothetical protein
MAHFVNKLERGSNLILSRFPLSNVLIFLAFTMACLFAI